MADAKTTLLCSIKFWASSLPGGAGENRPTLRRGARLPARKQGFSPSALDKAERELVKEGLVTKPRPGTVALTRRGIARAANACKRVSLAPWDIEASYPRRR